MAGTVPFYPCNQHEAQTCNRFGCPWRGCHGVFSRIPDRPIQETWVLISEDDGDFLQTGLAKTSLVKGEELTIVHHTVLARKIVHASLSLLDRIGSALKKALHLA